MNFIKTSELLKANEIIKNLITPKISDEQRQAFSIALAAISSQVPQKVIMDISGYDKCPNCNSVVRNSNTGKLCNYCPDCGKMLEEVR